MSNWRQWIRVHGTGMVLLSGLLLSLSGCGSMPALMKPSVDEAQAQQMMDEAQFRQAAQAYTRLAKYDRSQRVRYQLLSANAWREEGDYQQVRESLDKLKRNELTPAQAAQFDLLDAEILLDSNEPQGALSLLIADTSKLSPELAASYFELRAKAYVQLGDNASAAGERASLSLLLDPVEKAANEHEIRELLAKLTPDALRALLRSTPRDQPLYAYLRGLAAVPREGSARSFTESVANAPAVAKVANMANAQRDKITKIALLLPSSGPLAPAARAVQDGVLAAYFSDRESTRPELVLVDSGETPESGLAAYKKAIELGAERVIGPIAREQVSAIFQSSDAVLPSLALNFADASILPPQGSFQFALLPEEEAVAAAEHMFERGMKRVAVLVPEDDFGKRVAEAFTARFSALGGEVLEQAFYAPQSTDLSPKVQAAVGVRQSSERAQLVRSIVGIPFTVFPARRYDLEGIFVSGRPAQARLLLPQLRAFDAEDLPIVATSHVYSGTVNAEQDRDLSGLEFCDVPWVMTPRFETRIDAAGVPTLSEMRQLSSTVGAGGRLVAFGIDAYRLMNYLSWLEAHPGSAMSGATGLLSTDSSGSVRRRPSWHVMRAGVPGN